MSETKSNLLLGIGGSIAAYKTPDLSAQLRRSGFEIKSILSQAATQFVTKDSLAAMSRGEVLTSRDAMSDIWKPTHIDLASWADVALLAPATASTIGKLACGNASGLLAETFLALPSDVPRYIAPAMNGHMLNQPSVQRNLNQLEEDGFIIISPRSGELACGYEGDGKLAALPTIVQSIKRP